MAASDTQRRDRAGRGGRASQRRGLALVGTVAAVALGACGGSDGGGDGNRSPEASFTTSVTMGPAPLTVAFDATGSSDPDGQIVDYAWAFGDGRADAGATVSVVYPNNPLGGIYAFSIDPAPGGVIFRNRLEDNGLEDNGEGVELERIVGAELLGNSITRHGGAGIAIRGHAAPPAVSTLIAGNRLSENGLGVLVSTEAKPILVGNEISCNDYADLGSWGGQQIDARDNWWDHDPPTIDRGAGSNLVGCEPEGVDVRTAATYAGTPAPILSPPAGVSSCGSAVLGSLP